VVRTSIALIVIAADPFLLKLHHGRGTNTAQTIRDERLINRFDYDGDYGTVLNRFLMQAALNIPLTGIKLYKIILHVRSSYYLFACFVSSSVRHWRADPRLHPHI